MTLWSMFQSVGVVGFVGYNRVSSEHGGADDSKVDGGSFVERAATIMRMSEEEMNADSQYKDIVQTPLDRGYAWVSGQLRCGYALREEEPLAKWAGSKCEKAKRNFTMQNAWLPIHPTACHGLC